MSYSSIGDNYSSYRTGGVVLLTGLCTSAGLDKVIHLGMVDSPLAE